MKLEFGGTVCCEICNEVVRTTIDCPVCQKDDRNTDLYGDLIDMEIVEEIACTCGARFKLKSKDRLADDWEWEQIQEDWPDTGDNARMD